MENDINEKKHFWQTVPGVITGMAGVITAFTGLVIALNQIGCFHSEVETKNSIAQGMSSSTSKIGQEKVLNGLEVKFEGDLQMSKSDTSEDGTKTAKFTIRVTVNGQSAFYAEEKNFRLSIDDINIAPIKSTLTYSDRIDSNSSHEETLEFKIPANAKVLKFIIYKDDDHKEIALDPI